MRSFRPVDYPPSNSHCFIFLICKDRGFFCKGKKGEPPKSCLFTKAFVGVIIDLPICWPSLFCLRSLKLWKITVAATVFTYTALFWPCNVLPLYSTGVEEVHLASNITFKPNWTIANAPGPFASNSQCLTYDMALRCSKTGQLILEC